MTFWDHLDELRGVLVRTAVAVAVLTVVAFLFKEELFAVVLAPNSNSFVSYRMLGLSGLMPESSYKSVYVADIINTGLSKQFLIHMKVSFYAALMLASPYIVGLLFRFVSPGLYADERKYAKTVTVGGYVLFMTGVLVSYFLVFPLTFRFLSTYQVAYQVNNMISLDSYMSVFIALTLAMGVVFEMPVVAWLLGKLGVVDAGMMRKYRRHAIVAILVAAAVITPTSDIFTLLVVSLPMWLLYEGSILLVKKSRPREAHGNEDAMLQA